MQAEIKREICLLDRLGASLTRSLLEEFPPILEDTCAAQEHASVRYFVQSVYEKQGITCWNVGISAAQGCSTFGEINFHVHC